MERVTGAAPRAGARRAPGPAGALSSARALRVARAPARDARCRARAARRRHVVAVAERAGPRVRDRRRGSTIFVVGRAAPRARTRALAVGIDAFAARAIRIGHAEARRVSGVGHRRGREGSRAHGAAASHARHRARGWLAAVTVVRTRSGASGAVAVVRARDAVAAVAGYIGRAIAGWVLACRMRRATYVDGAVDYRGNRLASPVVGSPAPRAARAVPVVRARNALAARALVVCRAVAVGVGGITRERGVVVAAIGRTRITSRGEGRDTRAGKLTIESVPPAGAAAIAPAGYVVLSGDLDALRAQALVVVGAEATPRSRALARVAIAASEGAGEPRRRGARAAAIRTGATPVRAGDTRVRALLRRADAIHTRGARGTCVRGSAAAAVGVVGHEVDA